MEPTASVPRTPNSTAPSGPTSLLTYAVPAVRAAAGMAGPLKTASRALWHEVMGSFFALFAASFALAVWHDRSGATSVVPNERYRFYWFCALALLFGYFSASSFLRAKKRS